MQWLAIVSLLVALATIYSERARDILEVIEAQIPRVTGLKAGNLEVSLGILTSGKAPPQLQHEKLGEDEVNLLVEISDGHAVPHAPWGTIRRLNKLELVNLGSDNPYDITPTDLGNQAAEQARRIF